MADWTMWATFLAIGTGGAILATYLICATRTERMVNRILVLEREMDLDRAREEANEKKLGQIFDAVIALRETTEGQLSQLRVRLDDLLAEGFPGRNRSAA
jgi:hypothetical protein